MIRLRNPKFHGLSIFVREFCFGFRIPCQSPEKMMVGSVDGLKGKPFLNPIATSLKELHGLGERAGSVA